jgi:cell division protein FtsL
MHFSLEQIYTALLIVVFLVIGWFSVYVVYKLYQGQR